MEKLSMCRICLAEDGLRSIVDTHLHEMYESLMLCPFETKDRRPIYACYICCARLRNCYDLRQTCLQSEELLTQMLNRDENQPRLVPVKEKANKKRLSIAHPILLLSLGDLPRVDAASDVCLDIKPPKPLVDVKYENVDEGTADRTVEEDPSNVDYNIQKSDSDDDVIMTNIEHLEGSAGTADRTVEEDNVDYNIQTSDSDDDVIITNVEHLEGSADINMPMKSSLAAERNFEDPIFSELKDTPIVTVKVEVEDMKEIELIKSNSSSLTSGTADRTVEEDPSNVDYNIQKSDSDDDVIMTNIEHLEGSAGTADRTVEEDNVDYNIQTSDSDDDVIITNVEHLEGSADINMPMKSSLAAERNFEDPIFSELKDTPIVTVKVEVEDMKEIELIKSNSSSLTSDREVDVISLGTQQTFLDTSALILSDIEPSIMEAFWGWGSLTTVAEPQHVQTTVKTSPCILPRLAPKTGQIKSDTSVSETDERSSKGRYERLRRNDLKILLNNLKQLVPVIRDKKRATQPRILQEATALCRMFTQQEIEKDKLRIKQKQLATRLEELLKPP